MTRSALKTVLAATTILAGAAGISPATAQDAAPGEGLVMYMQMGGNPGDGATLARQTGAAEAARALGVQLNEQFSAWAPETMINHFKEAVAAQPDCIEIMGHPGSAAFRDLVAQAVDQGIVVTIDIGVFFRGKPDDVTLTASGGGVLGTDLTLEANNIDDDAERYHPSVAVGFYYRF
jgi:ABC-type sugar transport system substrate-binding protein